MVVLGFGLLWWGYLELVYGYTLLKGYDITWRQLANPVHPYQWPPRGQAPPMVPAGQILPKGAAAAQSGGGQPPNVQPGGPPQPNPQPGPAPA